jgi:hypothetical protein
VAEGVTESKLHTHPLSINPVPIVECLYVVGVLGDSLTCVWTRLPSNPPKCPANEPLQPDLLSAYYTYSMQMSNPNIPLPLSTSKTDSRQPAFALVSDNLYHHHASLVINNHDDNRAKGWRRREHGIVWNRCGRDI